MMPLKPVAIESIQQSFPTLVQILGESWIIETPEWEQFLAQHWFWFQQLNQDLEVLATRIAVARLIQCYRSALQVQDVRRVADLLYEIHGIALLSKSATEIELLVPIRQSTGRRFHVRVVIEGTVINAHSMIHLCLLSQRTSFGIRDSRADPLAEPADGSVNGSTGLNTPSAQLPGWTSDHAMLESAKIRERLAACVECRLPSSDCNLILFGHEERGRSNLEGALYGAEICTTRWDQNAQKVLVEWGREQTGAFRAREKRFRALSGVLGVHVAVSPPRLSRSYRLYLNHYATARLPPGVIETITKVMNTETLSP